MGRRRNASGPGGDYCCPRYEHNRLRNHLLPRHPAPSGGRRASRTLSLDHQRADRRRGHAGPPTTRVVRRYNITAADLQVVQDLLANEAVHMALTITVHGIATHPEDDLILSTAVSAQADYLVTGDRDLQALGSFRGVTIVSPRQFLAILQAPARS